jgi:hypothetical protein
MITMFHDQIRFKESMSNSLSMPGHQCQLDGWNNLHNGRNYTKLQLSFDVPGILNKLYIDSLFLRLYVK